MVSPDIKSALQSGKIGAVRSALKGVTLTQDELDACFILAGATAKKSIIDHVAGLGTVSNEAIGLAMIGVVRMGKDKILAEYIDQITNINLVGDSGRTLLSYAATVGKQKVIDMLLERGVDVNLADSNGNPPIHWAFRASKAKAAKSIIEKGVEIRGDVGRRLIEAAPNRPIQELLTANFLSNRVSSLSKEAFIDKWGPIKTVENPVSGCVDPLDNPIMKGGFYNVGYFPSNTDPNTLELDWEAIDAAKTLANELTAILKDANRYVPGSEGDEAYTPFFIPSLGRSPKTTDLDAQVSQDAKAEARGAYDAFVRSESDGNDLFFGIYFDPDDLNIDQTQFKAFMDANALAKKHLTNCKKYVLYSDFVTFPVIFGGVDRYFNFVGVITSAVWT